MAPVLCQLSARSCVSLGSGSKSQVQIRRVNAKAARHEGPPSKSAGGDHNKPLELAGGGYWWLNACNDKTVLYGEHFGFVIERVRVGGPGLVPASPAKVQPYRSPPGGAPAVRPKQALGIALAGCLVIDTEYEILEDAPPAAQPAGQACTGMVYVGSGGGMMVQDVGETQSRGHPRRTRRVRFTCNLCGESNEKLVNPHAWTQGSVFGQCDGCSVVHKLKDNLKIFHELGGPVFPPRHLRESFIVQDILDRIEARRARERGGEGSAED